MARDLYDFLPTDTSSLERIGLISVAVLALGGILLTWNAHKRKRPTPEELEAHRRAWLSRHGKLSGGEIVEFEGDRITYGYSVRGIAYTAAQDVAGLHPYLPANRWTVLGGAGIRYDGRNPANSIVVSETWSGLKEENRNAS